MVTLNITIIIVLNVTLQNIQSILPLHGISDYVGSAGKLADLVMWEPEFSVPNRSCC